MQAADLIARIAVVMKTCGEEQLMGHLGVVLYEYLGEEYPEVLGSILGALKVHSINKVSHKQRLLITNLDAGDRECDWHDENDSADQGLASSSDPHPEEQTRKGAGKLYRPCRENC
jgi:hypothetical protein